MCGTREVKTGETREAQTATSLYRYGFNGKENDNEVKGEGNQQDYGMRIYDPRIGKFLSVDPITSQYPELTPYQFASNTPIWGVDLDGLELMKVWENPDYMSMVYGKGTTTTTAWKINSTLNQAQSTFAPQPTIRPRGDCIGCEARHWQNKNQHDLQKNLDQAAKLDMISHGGPGFGQGLAKDPFIQASATTILGGGVTNLLKLGIVPNTPVGQFLMRASVDIIGQGIANKGDFSKTDVFDAGLAGVGKPLFSAAAGSLVDFKAFNDVVEKRVALAGVNKELSSVGIDLGFKVAFGGSVYGLGGNTKNALTPSLQFKSQFTTTSLNPNLTSM